MANPVVIEFIARGIPDIQRALRTVEQATAAAERASTRRSQQEATQRTRIADQEAKMKVRAMMKADQWHRQAQDRAVRETQKTAQAEVRAKERAAREQIRLEERAAREVARIKERAGRDVARAIAREESERSRAAGRWVRQEERRRFIEGRDEMRNRRRFAGAVGGGGAAALSAGVGRIAGMTVQTASIVGQLAGGFSIADSVQRAVGLKGKLADIASRDVDPTDPAKATRKSTSDLEGRVRAVSTEFGIDADSGADALDKFASKTGELQKGLDLLRGLGELSRAGAGRLDDLADAAGDIFNADKTQSAEQVLKQLREFAVQGQKGAVEMKDLASQMARITAAAGRFEGGAAKNITTMGALTQLARASGGASSSAEATTAVASLSNQFFKNPRLDAFKGLGVQVKTNEGYNRAVDDILIETMLGAEKKSRAGGHGLQDFDKLMGTAIADAQARKATTPLERAFKDAGGGEAGVQAARSLLGTFSPDAKRDLKTEFAGKARDRMQEDDAKLARVKEDFDRAVSQRIIPALMKLVPEFERLVPTFIDLNAKALPVFVDLIKTIADFADKNKELIADMAAHPFGTIIAVELTKQIATAGLGELFKVLISKAMGDAGLGPILQRVLSSQIGQAGLVVGAAAIAIQQGMIAIDNEYKKEDDVRTAARNDQVEAARIATRIRMGTATDEEKSQAAQLVTKLKSDADATQSMHDNPGFWKQLGGGLASFTDDGKQAAFDEEANHQQAMTDLTKTLRELEQAIQANTGATKANSTSTASGPNGSARAQSIVARN